MPAFCDLNPKSSAMHKQISGIVRTPLAEAVPIKKVTIHRAADCLCPQQAVLGMPVPEIFRKPDISDASFNT
ncbi:hypothetical protein [Raoultella terrigena]|uniref:hypothetical protein n=1 Tax=Raoultella terrigena TaxID=577 RepID=UPI0014319FB9|nr:hypothetical protein [Raoultella terrigena]QIT26413.1 hypothetical protein HCK03_07770 [Raoultella terrigena]